MTNKEIREHLRKGETASELLDKLGYTYGPNVPSGPPVWKAPSAGLLESLQEFIEKEIAARTPVVAPPEPVKAGDRFTIQHLPIHHKLRYDMGECWHHSVFTVREVGVDDRPNRALSGTPPKIVRFGKPGDPRNAGYWIPVSAITRIQFDDSF